MTAPPPDLPMTDGIIGFALGLLAGLMFGRGRKP